MILGIALAIARGSTVRVEIFFAKIPAFAGVTSWRWGSGALTVSRPCASQAHQRTWGQFMGRSCLFVALASSLAAAGPATAQSSAPTRLGAAESPIASSVSIPSGTRLFYISGTVPDVADPSAPAGSVARFGDTEAQTRSVLGKIRAELARHGLGPGDVVMMRVFLTAPPGQTAMDFAGMMRAYREMFGTPAQPNKPARSTMQVAGLVDPGWLVEIEVTAAKK